MKMSKSIEQLEQDVIAALANMQVLPPYHPDYEKNKKQLSRKLTAWAKSLEITVQVASNEQSPWLESEIGHTCAPMPLKKSSGVPQTGDYHAFLEDYNKYVGVCVERKGCTRKSGRLLGCDLYSTISNSNNRERFYREIERFEEDQRFEQMKIIVECSYDEFLSFEPSFNGRNFNKNHVSMNVPARSAIIAKIEAMGVSVMFADTRKHACGLFSDLVRQWCRLNYKNIIVMMKLIEAK